MNKRTIILAAVPVLCALASPAAAWGPWPFPLVWSHGVIVCNPPQGCRGSPYIPVPPLYIPPPVVVIPGLQPPPPGPGPSFRPPPAAPVGPLAGPPASLPRQAPASPPRPSKAEEAEQRGIETDITAFCESHPSEPFCVRLGKWLREHPREQAR